MSFVTIFSINVTSYWTCFIRFKHLSSRFLVFKMGLNTLVAQPAFTLWAKLWLIWKRFLGKVKLQCFFSWHPFSENIHFGGSYVCFTLHWPKQPNFSMVIYIYKIQVFDAKCFAITTVPMIDNFFFFHGNHWQERKVNYSKLGSLTIKTIPEKRSETDKEYSREVAVKVYLLPHY